MKKSTAVLSASALGLVAVGAGAAAPAAADPVVTPCTSDTQHAIGNTLGDNWYMDCVPQYGVGKAEFTVTSTTDMPVPLIDASTTATSTLPAAVDSYFTGTRVGAFRSLPTAGSLGATSQSYRGWMIAPISGVAAYDVTAPNAVPAVCSFTTPPTHGYVITYGSVTTTFTRTTATQTWTAPVTATPVPVTLAFTPDPVAKTTGEVCMWTDPLSASMLTAPDVMSHVLVNGTQTLAFQLPSQLFGAPMGSFAATAVDVVVDPVDPVQPAAGPELAATGIDPTPYLVTAGALAGLGALLAAVGYRRRRAKRHLAD